MGLTNFWLVQDTFSRTGVTTGHRQKDTGRSFHVVLGGLVNVKIKGNSCTGWRNMAIDTVWLCSIKSILRLLTSRNNNCSNKIRLHIKILSFSVSCLYEGPHLPDSSNFPWHQNIEHRSLCCFVLLKGKKKISSNDSWQFHSFRSKIYKIHEHLLKLCFQDCASCLQWGLAHPLLFFPSCLLISSFLANG